VERENSPIEELLAYYTAESCDFTNITHMKDMALVYVSRMPDSHLRCVLFTLANAVKEELIEV
jgi:hypothetical protein